MRSTGQPVERQLGFGAVAVAARRHGLLEIADGLLDLGAILRRDLFAMLLDGLLGLVDERVGLVADLDLVLPLAVVIGV